MPPRNTIESALKKAPSEDVGINVGIKLTLSMQNVLERLNISSRQAERLVAKLKADGRITRLGSNKSGSWKVNQTRFLKP